MIAPLNTRLDSWPGIKLNRHRRASSFVPRGGVKSATKGVKRVVIASGSTRNLGAGHGIRTRDIQLGKLALYQLS
jgi:hypothetical protein